MEIGMHWKGTNLNKVQGKGGEAGPLIQPTKKLQKSGGKKKRAAKKGGTRRQQKGAKGTKQPERWPIQRGGGNKKRTRDKVKKN